MITQERLMTVKEVASELRIAPQTLRFLVNAGRIPAIRIGGEEKAQWRFRRSDVDAWLEERMVGRR